MSLGFVTDYRARLEPTIGLIKFIGAHLENGQHIPINIVKCLRHAHTELPEGIVTLPDELNENLSKKSALNYEEIEYMHKLSEAQEQIQSQNKEKPNGRKNKAKNSETLDENEHEGESDVNCEKLHGMFLYLHDLHWLNDFFRSVREQKQLECYLHDYLMFCDLILPQNDIHERDPQLEERCVRLRQEQAAREYRSMTKNVDPTQKNQPEDTIAYQLKSVNKQIIGVLQVIISVAASFFFGYFGLQLIVGEIKFENRLLLGTFFAMLIALAEIYFFAKHLDKEEAAMEASAQKKTAAASNPNDYAKKADTSQKNSKAHKD